jgi:hypothetical protein
MGTPENHVATCLLTRKIKVASPSNYEFTLIFIYKVFLSKKKKFIVFIFNVENGFCFVD